MKIIPKRDRLLIIVESIIGVIAAIAILGGLGK